MGPDAMILVLYFCLFFFFLIFSFKPALSLSSFTLIKRLLRSSLLSAVRVVSSAYLRLLMFLLPILIPACNLSSCTFLMMCSAYRLNKHGDRRQPCRTPVSILNPSVVPFRVLTVASWATYRFLGSWVLSCWGRFLMYSPFFEEFFFFLFLILNRCWILLKASASIEIIIWILSFILLIWYIILIDLYLLKNPYIPGVNPIWSWVYKYVV